MSQTARTIGVPWFRRDSYRRIQKLPGSDLKDSFEQWEERALRMYNVMHSAGQRLTKVLIEPDELRSFADEIGADTVDANVRAELASRKLAELQQDEPLAVCDMLCLRCGAPYPVPEELARLVEMMHVICECGGRLKRPSPFAAARAVKTARSGAQ